MKKPLVGGHAGDPELSSRGIIEWEIRAALTARTGESYQTSLRRVAAKFPEGEMPFERFYYKKRQEESEDERFEFNLRALLGHSGNAEAIDPMPRQEERSPPEIEEAACIQ